jgi:4'-phosphopantetheinyl transferase
VSSASPPSRRSAPELRAGAVHVWHVRLDDHRAHLTELAAALSAAERARAERFRRRADADAFVLRRGILRELVARYLGGAAADVQLGAASRGKPFVADGHGQAPLQLNAASSGDVALFAFARDRPVGVDVERIRPLPDLPGVSERVLCAAELAALRALDDAARLRSFFAAWTQKEAFVKAHGDGFAIELDGFAVPPGGAPDSATLVDGRRIEVLETYPGYAAAVAADGDGWRAEAQSYPPASAA